MKIKKLNVRGFSHILLPLLVVVVIAIAGTAYLVASHAATAKTAQFTGTITQDECATVKVPIGDVGCNITVGNIVVTVAHGNIIQTQPWGQVIGFATLKTNYTGRQVQVYAAVIDGTNYTLKGSTAYYVRLVPTPALPG
jgi:type 1 fimbria pilin